MTLQRAVGLVPLLLVGACGSDPTSVKHADTAGRATTADTADQVNWAGVQGKPSWVLSPTTYAAAPGGGLTLTGNAFSLAATTRSARAYYPASGLATTSSLVRTTHGVSMPATGSNIVTWIGPRPIDWVDSDTSKPFKVTLYFIVPPTATAGDMRWQLTIGGASINLPPADATTGWDSPGYVVTANAALDTYAPDGGGHAPGLLKSQSWTAAWSTTYGSWYIPPTEGLSSNSFSNFMNPIWQFGFRRGHAVGNGEANTADFTVIGVSIDYPAAP